MSNADAQSPSLIAEPAPASVRWLSRAALAAALLVAVVFAWRPLASPDIGYHLAYGEHFLDTGRIVDHNPYIYTLPAPGGDQPEPGPGCWYDEQGRYRFPNANWLSQVVMSWVYRSGGVMGLCILRLGLVAATFLALAFVLRRLGVSATAAAAGVLLVAAGSYERFALRPEMFGALILALEMLVLAGRRVRWRGVAALVVLQLAFVNLHSYFLLGVALTGAVLADRLLRLTWRRLRRSPATPSADGLAREATILAAATAGQLAVCLVNPWTWRIAVLPVQTILYLRAHHIHASDLTNLKELLDPTTPHHPWAMINELFKTIGPEVQAVTVGMVAFYVSLVVGGAGALAAIVRRRWGLLLWMAGFAAVALSAYRNAAVGVFVIVPAALGALWPEAEWVGRRMGVRARNALAAGACGCVILLAAGIALATVTHKLYYRENSPVRFAGGVGRTFIPVGAIEWLNTHRPAGRLWADSNISSNVYFFTRPHPDVPLVTNTWAYPPKVMTEVLVASSHPESFRKAADRYDLQVVVLRVDRSTEPLVRALAGRNETRWTLVYVDNLYTIFVRTAGPNAELAREQRITEATLDLEAFKGRLKRLDPLPAYQFHMGGMTMQVLGWRTAAIRLYRRAVGMDDGRVVTWNNLGLCLAMRGTDRLDNEDERGQADWKVARKCFLRALELDPAYKPARKNLALVERQITELRSGRLLLPRR